MRPADAEALDVVVIGAGQAGLAVGWYLRRTGLSHVLLDEQEGPGGAWRHGWDSLRLFSPAPYSSLPGRLLPGDADRYPTRDEVLDYLRRYEARYEIPVRRPVRVSAVRSEGSDAGGVPDRLVVVTDGAGRLRARTVVSATGTWRRPHVPDLPGRDAFRGRQLHSAGYRSPEPFRGRSVLVVGGGNSGAQVAAEVSRVARIRWATRSPPTFLPDDVDGRVLFERATERWRARREGRPEPPPGDLGDIVAVPPVREARRRGALDAVPAPVRLTEGGAAWADGHEEAFDAVIWCTGFRPALDHLAPLGVMDERGRIEVEGTRSVREPRLWLVGYGEWTGWASATLIGVGRSARATVEEIAAALAPGRGRT